ncbi:Myb/SANT-like DNA-binding domain protein [Thalictrum thalictroides]|uniref:Myb/SANT-like DNA-binding domain protein n=1 Tax=Thalictrum thalictroides TaxID=46969 RepID=A0A7J6VVS2_THATH|nr:Myb/SANT-like DNA-binding domain protein [Thalictrum thalictroides]
MSSNEALLTPFELVNEVPTNWTIRSLYNRFYGGLGHNVCKKAFKNKLNHLKDRFKDFKNLVEKNTGLGWDPVLKTVEAPHEWWENYLKNYPRCKRFRTQGCQEYLKLGTIFGDTIATGDIQTGVAGEFNTSDENDDTVPATQFPSHGSQNTVTNDERDQEEQRHQFKRSRSTTNTRRSRNNKSSDLSEAVKMMAEASQTRNEMKNKYTIQECMAILDTMGELDEDTYMRAMKLLQVKGWRESFVLMSDERRKGWLHSIERGVL